MISINAIGPSDPSDLNTAGAAVKDMPQKPATPLRDDDSTTDTALGVTYAYDDTSNTVTGNGGWSITSAALYWDAGSGTDWQELIGENADDLVCVCAPADD